MAKEKCKPKCVKKGGGQDHRCNDGKDRTPSQKTGDKKREK